MRIPYGILDGSHPRHQLRIIHVVTDLDIQLFLHLRMTSRLHRLLLFLSEIIASLINLLLRTQEMLLNILSVYSYIEFCLWNAVDDCNNFQRNFSTGEVEVQPEINIGTAAMSAIYHKTEYRERRNHYAVHAVSTAASGFDTSRESFIGTYGSPAMPKAVKEGTSYNSIASGWSPVGSFRIDIDLEPGEEKEYVFIIGYAENPDDKKWESFGIINKRTCICPS